MGCVGCGSEAAARLVAVQHPPAAYPTVQTRAANNERDKKAEMAMAENSAEGHGKGNLDLPFAGGCDTAPRCGAENDTPSNHCVRLAVCERPLFRAEMPVHCGRDGVNTLENFLRDTGIGHFEPEILVQRDN